MKKIKLVVVGCSGRMGQQIIKEIQKYKNINLIAAIEKKNSPSINKNIKKIKITSDKEIAFRKANTIIDFSLPSSTLETVKYAAKLLGLCDESVRLPLVTIMDNTKNEVKKSLIAAKLING